MGWRGGGFGSAVVAVAAVSSAAAAAAAAEMGVSRGVHMKILVVCSLFRAPCAWWCKPNRAGLVVRL